MTLPVKLEHMGLCCSVEVVDADTSKGSQLPVEHAEVPARIDEEEREQGEEEGAWDVRGCSEVASASQTLNVEALRRARDARGSMKFISSPSMSSEVGELV